MGTLDIENTGDHPQHPKLANYHYRMTGPVHGGDTDHWHEGTLRDVERARGYWAHVKEVLNALDCESEPMDDGERHNTHLQLSPSGDGSSQQNTPRPEGD